MLDGTGGDGASSRLRLQGRYLVFGHYCHRGMSTSRTRVVAVVLTNYCWHCAVDQRCRTIGTLSTNEGTVDDASKSASHS
jgi:hypothetical protein